MTKANLIHSIINDWSGTLKKHSWTFEQQQSLVKELGEYLMVKKSKFSQKNSKANKK